MHVCICITHTYIYILMYLYHTANERFENVDISHAFLKVSMHIKEFGIILVHNLLHLALLRVCNDRRHLLD